MRFRVLGFRVQGVGLLRFRVLGLEALGFVGFSMFWGGGIGNVHKTCQGAQKGDFKVHPESPIRLNSGI